MCTYVHIKRVHAYQVSTTVRREFEEEAGNITDPAQREVRYDKIKTRKDEIGRDG